MTLQDDIENLREEWNAGEQYAGLDAHIAAGLERDYCLVKLDSLPDVEEAAGIVSAGNAVISEDFPVWEVWDVVRDRLALALHLEARESEAAVLARRRDELARQYGSYMTYDIQSTMTKDLIDRLISADADYTEAAEDEVARLKATT